MIRKATAGDAFRIAEIQVGSWRVAYRGILPDDYLAGLDVNKREDVWRKFSGDAEAPLFVACEGAEIVGFCHLMSSRDDDAGRTAEIAAIYLDPGHWRRGHGRALCSAALSFAGGRDFDAATLWVLAENVSARRFYEAMGFRPDGATKQEGRPGFCFNEVRYRIGIAKGE